MRVLVWWMLLLAGCGASVYPYRVTNNKCDCELFTTADDKVDVTYSFSGVYSLHGAMNTRITGSIQNNTADTLDLSLAYVKVSSRNIPYRYNDKFLPVTIASVPPGQQRTLLLEGEVEELKESDPWLAIAGEELVVTLKGMRINGKQLSPQIIRFVPQNPKLSSSY